MIWIWRDVAVAATRTHPLRFSRQSAAESTLTYRLVESRKNSRLCYKIRWACRSASEERERANSASFPEHALWPHLECVMNAANWSCTCFFLERVASCFPHVPTCLFGLVGTSVDLATRVVCVCALVPPCLEIHASSINIVLEKSGPLGRRCLRAFTMRFSRQSR